MSFNKKAAEIMQTLQSDYGDFKIPAKKNNNVFEKQMKPCKHSCSSVSVKMIPPTTNRFTRQTLIFQNPIIIQKKNHAKSLSNHHHLTERAFSKAKKIEPFTPISIPTKERNKWKIQPSTIQQSRGNNKQIEIFLDESSDKQCLKKLFKKIHRLQEELAQSQRERMKIKLEYDHISKRDIACKQHEKIINKLQSQKYRLQIQNQSLKKALQNEARLIPKSTTKQIVVQKPIQVKVQVPKYIPGPQRVVQRIIEVPKYIQIEKKVPQIIIKEIQVQKIVQKPIYIDKPIYKDPIIVDKPIFVDKPIYIDRPVQVQKKVNVQVPFEVQVPVYIDRPLVDEDWLRRFQQIQDELGLMMKQNHTLKNQNHSLKFTLDKLQSNLDILNQHNRQKNRQVQILLNNNGDYLPIKINQRQNYNRLHHQNNRLQRKYSTLDLTNSTSSPKSPRHLRYL